MAFSEGFWRFFATFPSVRPLSWLFRKIFGRFALYLPLYIHFHGFSTIFWTFFAVFAPLHPLSSRVSLLLVVNRIPMLQAFNSNTPSQQAHVSNTRETGGTLEKFPSQKLLPSDILPSSGIKAVPDSIAHYLKLLADKGRLDQQPGFVLMGHEVLHNAGTIL